MIISMDSLPNTNVRKNKSISNEVRELVLNRIRKGDRFVDISQTFCINYETFRTINKTFKKTGEVVKRDKGHRSQALIIDQK